MKPRLTIPAGLFLYLFFTCYTTLATTNTDNNDKAINKQYGHINFSVADGLCSSEIYTFYQDSKGYLWVSTSAGISRYNGNEWQCFTKKDGLAHYNYSSIHEDNKGYIWFKSRRSKKNKLLLYDGRKFNIASDSVKVFGTGGIYYHLEQVEPLWLQKDTGHIQLIHPYQEETLLQPDFLQYNYIHDMMRADSNNLYLATQLGLVAYNCRGEYNNLTKAIGRTTQVYQMLYRKGQYWLQTDEGIWLFDGTNFSNDIIPEPLQRNVTQNILLDRRGNIWLGTVKGLYCYNGNSFKQFNTTHGLITNRIYRIMLDSQDNLWVVTENGLMVYRNGKFITLDKEKAGFVNPQLGFVNRFLMEDKEGNIWINHQDGLTCYLGFAFTHYYYKQANKLNLNCLLNDTKGRLWLGFQGDGLKLVDSLQETTSFMPSNNNFPFGKVYDIAEDKQGNIWISGENGLLKYKENGEFENININNNLKYPFIGNIEVDKQNNLYLTSSNYLYHYNTTTKQTKTYFLKSENGRGYGYFGAYNPYISIRSLLVDQQDSVWVATLDGVFKLNTDSSQFRLVGDDSYFGSVSAMQQDNTGNIWMLRSEGDLLRYDGKFVSIITEKEGLSNSNIRSLQITGDYAWLGLVRGIDQLDIKRFNADGQVAIVHLNQYNGFTPIECGYVSYASPKGQLWFNHNEGISSFTPNLLKQKSNKLKLEITEIKLAYETVDWFAYSEDLAIGSGLPNDLQLNYDENTLSFRFDVVRLANKNNMYYRHRLKTPNTDDNMYWQTATKGQVVTYVNLSPDTYTFEVEAYASQQPDRVYQQTFSFTILPAFWQQPIFILKLVLGLLMVLTVFVLWVRLLRYIKNLKQKRVVKI